MRFWKWFERRAAPTRKTTQSAADYHALFDSGPTASTMVVTPERALQVPAVFSCIQVLAQDVARTPIRLRRKVAEDSYVDAVEHDLFEIVSTLPNPEMTAYQVKHRLMWDLMMYGRAYAQIVREGGRVVALWPLEANRMRVDRTAALVKRWTYAGAGGTFTWLFDPSMPPILELTHETPLRRCRELIGTALALQTYTGKFFANGGRLAGVLQAAGAISDTTAATLRETWDRTFGRPENSHKVAILDGGLEYKPFAVANDESQLNETMASITTQICGVFRVPAWKAGNLDKTSYSNMESSSLDYITSTLDPLFQLWEDAMRRDLLTARQFGQYTLQFDRSALLRSDVKSLHEALAKGIQSGIYSQNDARRKLGENPIADGDRYLVNSALQPVGAEPHVG
jgi:HK97 family phage portal protein